MIILEISCQNGDFKKFNCKSISQKNVHLFTDNIVRKVSSGQICPHFYGHVCLLVLLIFCLYKKRTLSLLFPSNVSYPSPTKNFYFEKGKKHLNIAGIEPYIDMIPQILISSLRRYPLDQLFMSCTQFLV